MAEGVAHDVRARTPLAPTVGDRLGGARRRRFAGRAAELELFRSALEAPVPPFNVLWVHGVGGVGKTTLLGALADVAEDVGLTPVRMDLRGTEPSPVVAGAFAEVLAMNERPQRLLRPGIARRVLAAALRPLDRPALVLWGRHDPYLGVEHAEREREAFPHAEVQVLDESGHWPFVDEPAAVADALARHLARVDHGIVLGTSHRLMPASTA